MIYFDNSATTPICRRALDIYNAVSLSHFGNPSSLHAVGKDAEDVMKNARRILLASVGAQDGAIVFTASGTEANNLALFGRAHAKERYRGKKILTSAGEHASVNSPLAALRREGMTVEEIPTVGGELDLAALEDKLTPDVILVSVMMVNNETGALYDIAAVSRLIKEKCPDCALHVDATQAFFKVPFSVRGLGIGLLTVSSHKIEGPKGCGALYIDRSLLTQKGISPLILGGGQEEGFRSGTENVPGIAAFGEACLYCKENFAEFTEQTRQLRDYLIARIQSEAALAEVRPLLPPRSAPHILCLILPGIRSEVMLHALSARGISVSSGSACSSHGHVGASALLSFGCREEEADCAIRISLSHRNTREEADEFLAALSAECARLARRRK